jgi:hypothetical protein
MVTIRSRDAAATFAAPCETTTQFPKSAVVVNEARQKVFGGATSAFGIGRDLDAELLHADCSRNLSDMSIQGKRVRRKACTGSPLIRSWAVKKWVPVPDASTCTVLIDREPPLKTFRSADSFAVTSERGRCTHESKPVMLAVKIPFAIVSTAV